jgi:hypothetical protein
MRLRQLVVAVAVMMALAACRGDRETITGSYGSGILAGSVVLAGIEGSPEGVEVSVRDTGMTTVLGADGRFTFAGVPENAILDFRRADGVQASLAVNGNGKGRITIELGKGGANKSSTRGNKNKDKQEFEGLILTASASEITLLTSQRQEVTIGLTGETVIRKGNQMLLAADLLPDTRVHVRARKVDDAYVAQQIVVQGGGEDDEDGERPQLRQYEGTVVRAGATELVIFDAHKAEVAFAITAETVVRKGNTPVAPADLLPGQRVHVKATVAAGGAATAVQITLQNTREQAASVSGTVLGVAGSNITVKTKSGEAVVQTNASTRIREKGKAIGLSDISAGDSLSAKGTRVSENTILASEVEIRSKSGHP